MIKFHALTRKITYPILSLFICIIFQSASYANGVCSGTSGTLDCLSENFTELYSANYSSFWKILHESASKAQKCETVTDAVHFMRLVHLNSNNAEFNEFFSETIENICIKNDKCFFESLLRLNKSDQNRIIKMLKYPLFIDQSSISETFSKWKNNKKYKKFVDLYFEKDN